MDPPYAKKNVIPLVRSNLNYSGRLWNERPPSWRRPCPDSSRSRNRKRKKRDCLPGVRNAPSARDGRVPAEDVPVSLSEGPERPPQGKWRADVRGSGTPATARRCPLHAGTRRLLGRRTGMRRAAVLGFSRRIGQTYPAGLSHRPAG